MSVGTNRPVRKGIPATYTGNTTNVVSKEFRVTGVGAKAIRVDFVVGRVDITTGITCSLAHSSGYGLWDTVAKTGTTVTASTEKTVTVVAATDVWTDGATHGYSDGDAVMISANTAMPGGVSVGQIYYAKVINATTYYLCHDRALQRIVDVTSTGTAVRATKCRVFSFKLLAEDNGWDTDLAASGAAEGWATHDAADLPLRAMARAVMIGTHANDRVDVGEVLVMQAD